MADNCHQCGEPHYLCHCRFNDDRFEAERPTEATEEMREEWARRDASFQEFMDAQRRLQEKDAAMARGKTGPHVDVEVAQTIMRSSDLWLRRAYYLAAVCEHAGILPDDWLVLDRHGLLGAIARIRSDAPDPHLELFQAEHAERLEHLKEQYGGVIPQDRDDLVPQPYRRSGGG